MSLCAAAPRGPGSGAPGPATGSPSPPGIGRTEASDALLTGKEHPFIKL
ncbi:hypothetical protein [Herbaspirillum robiniae]|nr:hypothetical protein [Herbaspirillum robiniae]